MSGGQPKAFRGPEDLAAEYARYKEDILENPIEVIKWVGKDALERIEKHFKPPTWKGFEAFLYKTGRIHNLDRYRRNVDKAYTEYQGILRAIGADMFDRKFSGAAVGIYNHAIIAKELHLAEPIEVSTFERPILEGGKELPQDDDDGIIDDPLL